MENATTEHILKLNGIILELFEIIDDIYDQKEFCGALDEDEKDRYQNIKDRYYKNF